jgi:hypothetical protein
LELKTADDTAGTSEALILGMDQIRARGYGEAYDSPILISLAVDKKRRNIGACIYGKEEENSVLDINKAEHLY